MSFPLLSLITDAINDISDIIRSILNKASLPEVKETITLFVMIFLFASFVWRRLTPKHEDSEPIRRLSLKEWFTITFLILIITISMFYLFDHLFNPELRWTYVFGYIFLYNAGLFYTLFFIKKESE